VRFTEESHGNVYFDMTKDRAKNLGFDTSIAFHKKTQELLHQWLEITKDFQKGSGTDWVFPYFIQSGEIRGCVEVGNNKHQRTVCGTLSFRAEVKECEYKVVTDQEARIIAKQRERLIAKFTNLNTGYSLKSSILTGLKQKIQVEDLTLKAHEIPYTPFDDEIILNSVG